jgi:adenosine deaminase
MDYQHLPKIELHLHLDCSLSYKVVQQIDPAVTYEDYCHSFVAPPHCTDLLDYLTRAVKGFELMQTKEQLRLVTLDLFEQLKADNVIYAEIRFAPLLHLGKGLSPVEVVETVDAAFTEGKAMTGMEGGLILCTLRNYTEEQSLETVKLVQQFRGTNVLAFDMAGDEAGYPVAAHVKAFQFAKDNGIHCTCHAGEAKGPESVWDTLGQLHPTRIGHGVRSAEDEKLLDHLVKKDIHLEICPTSNIQTNIFRSIEQHAADKIYRHGVSMSINTDARTVTPVTLSSEYNKLQDVFHWDKAHFLQCNLEGIRHSFTTEAVKQKIAVRIQEAYNNC